MKYLIFSQDQETEQPIKWFENFDKEAIKEAIIDHLTANPTDCVEYCKEPPKSDLNRFCGYIIIDFYEVNPKTNEICRVITKGDKTYYKKLN